MVIYVLFDNGLRADSFGFDNVDTSKFRSAEFTEWSELVEYAIQWLEEMRSRTVDYVTLSSDLLVNEEYYYSPDRRIYVGTYYV